MAIQSKNALDFSVFFFFFCYVGKRKSCAIGSFLCFESSASIFGSFQGVVESHSLHQVTIEYLLNLQWRRSRCNTNGDLLAL